ncbi:MAG: sigma-70 family RNA polymerase sigma factor [Candidatus Pacebacteria bacterium]|nr:sigma-70 family RNA polymerase sigma factor [Candidatus Paceibacterota bacterium]
MVEHDQDSSDQDLVRASLADRHSFALLVSRYEQRLRRYVMRLGMLDPENAKDILQESFIKAYINLNDYDQSLPFSAWLYRIARNETFSHYRRQKNRPRVLESADEEMFERVADDLNIEHEANKTSAHAAVRAAVESLDLKYRDIVLLRYFEDKSYAEISDILELPEGTVAAYINRAKAKLKEALKRYDESNQ